VGQGPTEGVYMSNYVGGNALLTAMPVESVALLSGALESVALPLGLVLCNVGDDIPFIYFPADAIVSLIQTQADGASVEIAMVGHEGMVDASFLLGSEKAVFRAQVLSAGKGFRIPTSLLRHAVSLSPHGSALCLRFLQAQSMQVAQIALCNRHHRLDQQLCRWLLQNMDRLALHSLTVTQELIAGALGVRREGVTEAAGKLQAAGVIHYSRGHITVTDRSALERQTCECYRAMRAACTQLLPYWRMPEIESI
jgi:CRP-like cAMP-binding protein